MILPIHSLCPLPNLKLFACFCVLVTAPHTLSHHLSLVFCCNAVTNCHRLTGSKQVKYVIIHSWSLESQSYSLNKIRCQQGWSPLAVLGKNSLAWQFYSISKASSIKSSDLWFCISSFSFWTSQFLMNPHDYIKSTQIIQCNFYISGSLNNFSVAIITSLQMAIADMKLKDTYSLEEKLSDQSR